RRHHEALDRRAALQLQSVDATVEGDGVHPWTAAAVEAAGDPAAVDDRHVGSGKDPGATGTVARCHTAGRASNAQAAAVAALDRAAVDQAAVLQDDAGATVSPAAAESAVAAVAAVAAANR